MSDSDASTTADDASRELQGLRNLQRGVGEVSLLMAAHPMYGSLFLGDIRRTVMMPVLHNQYRIVRNNSDRTLGFISWARVSEGVHKRLMHGVLKLEDRDWNSGDLTVVMDVVAFDESAAARMLREVKETLFADAPLWVVDGNAGAHEPKLRQYTAAAG